MKRAQLIALTALLMALNTEHGLLNTAHAQVPLQFTYQGRLTDSSGVPIVGTVTGTIAVIRGGTALEINSLGVTNYAETVVVTNDTSGVFSHIVGTGAALPGQTLDVSDFEVGSGQLYVEVRIGGAALLPRQPIVSAPYSLSSPGVVPVGAVLMWWGSTNGSRTSACSNTCVRHWTCPTASPASS